jgi:hypothetical protein
MNFVITKKAMRPASQDQNCFYCREPVGGYHKDNCVLIRKKVRVLLVIKYTVLVPHHWKRENIESHRNEGSWCASNLIEELKELDKTQRCLCSVAHFECLDDTGDPFLDED